MKKNELKPLQLVQTPRNEVLKVSNLYEDGRVSAQVLYPLPARTTVRFYSTKEIDAWREPSAAIIAKYEIAWGFR